MSYSAQEPSPIHQDESNMLLPLEQISQQHNLGDLAGQFAGLRDWLATDLVAIESILGQAALLASNQQGAQAVQTAAQHLLQQQGKRLRPLCVLVASHLGEQTPDRQQLYAVAAASELVHTATLLHDDVIDLGTERRGQPTARMLYGNATSILAGDGLLVGALQRLVDHQLFDLLHDLLQVVRIMVQAEAWQLAQRGRFVVDCALYEQIIGGKTAALFAWSLQAGGKLARLGPDAVSGLARVGHHVGCAFQLVDDVLDISPNHHAVLGKDAFADVREGKLTWPLMYALEREPTLLPHLQAIATLSNPSTQASCADVLEQHYVQVQRMVERTQALQATRNFARQHIASAEQGMQHLAAGWPKEALQLVLNMAVERTY